MTRRSLARGVIGRMLLSERLRGSRSSTRACASPAPDGDVSDNAAMRRGDPPENFLREAELRKIAGAVPDDPGATRILTVMGIGSTRNLRTNTLRRASR